MILLGLLREALFCAPKQTKKRPKPSKILYKKSLKALQTKAFLLLSDGNDICENMAMEVMING